MSEGTVLWCPGGFAEDRWTHVGGEGELPEAGAVVVPLSRWDELRGRNTGELGVLIPAGERVEDIADDLDRLSLVALDFPKFTDGRAYSAARLLRERYDYSGEIRATGDVLIDQIPFMIRCGFDSFAISHEPTKRALAEGRIPEVPIYLQPVGERGEVPPGTRPWLRRKAQP